MGRLRCLLLLLLLSVTTLGARNVDVVDSLFILYTSAPPSEKTMRANELAKALYEGGYIDTLMTFGKRGSVSEMDLMAFSGTAYCAYENGNYRRGIELGIESAGMAGELKDSVSLSDSYSTVSCAFVMLGDFEKALVYARKCLDIDSRLGDEVRLCRALSNMATLYMLAGKNREAYDFIKRSVEIERRLDDPEKLAIRLGKLSEISLKLGDGRTALDAIDEALSLDREGGRDNKVAVRLSQKGDIYLDGGDWDNAESCYREALDFFRESGDRNSIMICNNQLGNLYARQSEKARAADYYTRSMEISRELGNNRMLQNNLRALCTIYGANNPSKALSYLEEYVEVRDSVMSAESQRQLDEFRVQYDTQQKENEIAIFKVRGERDRVRLNFFIVGAVLLLLVVVLLLVLNRSVSARNKALKEMDAMKDRFYSVISHDLKNPVIAARLSLENICSNPTVASDKGLSESCRGVLRSAESQSALVEDLLLWTRLQTGKMPCVPVVFSLSSTVREAVSIEEESLSNKELTLRTDIPSGLTARADRMMVSTVLRNLLSNAVKFSYRGGEILVSAAGPVDGKLTVSVSDHGSGMPAEKSACLFRLDRLESTDGTEGEKGSGIGLDVCKDMVEKCGGAIGVRSEEGKGSVFFFSIPAAPETGKDNRI